MGVELWSGVAVALAVAPRFRPRPPGRGRGASSEAVGTSCRPPCAAREAGPLRNSLRAPSARSAQTDAASQMTKHACPSAGMRPAPLRCSALHRRAAPPARRPRPAWWGGDCCRGSRERRRARPDLLLSPLGRGGVRGCATVDSVHRCACRAAPIPAFPQRGKEQDRSGAGGLTERPTNAQPTLKRLAAPGPQGVGRHTRTCPEKTKGASTC